MQEWALQSKNLVYLGHCAAHSEESVEGKEGNAFEDKPQLLHHGLVLQKVVQKKSLPSLVSHKVK